MAEKDKALTECKGKLDKIAKLLVVAKDLHEKQGAILAEVDALLEGKATIGQRLQAALAAFDRVWCSRYAPTKTVGYFWRGTTDAPAMKRLLKAMTVEDLEARAVAFMADNDPAVVRARHPFQWFVARINQYTGAGGDLPDFELVAGCQHDPPCRNDVEHTKRRGAEMRA